MSKSNSWVAMRDTGSPNSEHAGSDCLQELHAEPHPFYELSVGSFQKERPGLPQQRKGCSWPSDPWDLQLPMAWGIGTVLQGLDRGLRVQATPCSSHPVKATASAPGGDGQVLYYCYL